MSIDNQNSTCLFKLIKLYGIYIRVKQKEGGSVQALLREEFCNHIYQVGF